jgi:predicted CoA-binding protein
MTTMTTERVDEDVARRFLDSGRIAVVGASDQKGNFGAAIAKELLAHGVDVVVVHPSGLGAAGCPGYAGIGDVPGPVAGAILVLPPAASLDAVRACIAAGVRRIWFFRGIGAPGAATDEAVAAAHAAGLEVVPGACPLMFLEPVSWFHRIHRSVRRRRGDLRTTG